MQDQLPASRSVVVGIDGSRNALDAALWAVDEAVSRDIPLRLVYAIDPDHAASADPNDAARELAKAEIAIRYAFVAVESTDQPVKIEVEILQERPIRALLEASRWAAMLCVGSMGLKHSSHGQVGSTAAALAASARCPVTIVRRHDPRLARHGCVVAEVDASSVSDGVLARALEEARLRRTCLRVLTTWQSRFTDRHDGRAVADANRLASAQLDRRLAQWKKRHPDLDVRAVTVHGNTLDYLTRNAGSIQLLVASHERAHGIRELLRPPGYAALHNADCSVLICEPRTLL
jgi:nucleotide-binding universal stress UspA family protein